MKQPDKATVISTELYLCPICNLRTARLLRGKLQCLNCGFLES